ncbi:16S rRNA (guanine(966)-N(2))-methyltransferase RsmD [Hydrogenoanaerobacterium sp.]|uniref:16S rRNA (guanine(966)-N(2))-methyltransferase RsmD n=1 Tax=Hydrogenoanaerobacterium sp. TaxID=2953763 RepID=UPI00289709FC|nr:16S rRNA (guanine(966)-N(2))-methyltransferase RsmD [Hydrogenoanaerobacterium sp.]
MRVITGTARGRKLVTPEGMDTRPTTDMVKESIFSIIQFDVPGANVLDLFAGSGQMGIEAISRGAIGATFVDSAKLSVTAIKQNLDATGFIDKSKVYPMEAKTYLMSAAERFDIAFLDPPYHQGLLADVLPSVAKLMRENSIIVCETQSDEKLPEAVGEFTLRKTYRYGKILVHVYKNEGDDEE